MTTALLDGDIYAFRAAASSENEEEWIALSRFNDSISKTLQTLQTDNYILFFSGENNFRKKIYPEYKANRKDKPLPKHLNAIRELGVTRWEAKFSHHCETDDMLGINQNENTIICSIDKDLLQIPGRHFNYVKQQERIITPIEGLRLFYIQMVLGDKSDNIFGYDGKARQTVPKFLEESIALINSFEDEKELDDFVFNMYHNRYMFEVNKACLWIWRKWGDIPNKEMFPELVIPNEEDI